MDDSLLVVIVNFGLSDHIQRLLEDGAFSGFDVVLVDNASEPERLEQIANRFGAEVLLLDRNYGFAGAVNRAVAHAGPTSEILLANPDLEMTRADVSRLRSARASGDFTAVSPLLLNADGTVQVGTAGGRLTAASFATYFLLASHLFPRARGTYYTRRQLMSGLEPAWLCMACLLLDGGAFRRFGPIPEDELVYGEDLAWGDAASRSGARFAVITHVPVTHAQGAAGASSRSRESLARLALRINGRVRGRVAVVCMWVGVFIRRVSRRFVPGQRL